MKIFVSADLEGVAGVVHGEHTLREGKEHDRARKLMTYEVNAAIEGALEAGATSILVNDSHGTMRNIIPEELHEAAELITGSPKPLSMMQGIDATFNAALFIGYHARRGSYIGVLEHTYHGGVVSDVFMNGQPMGETGLNAALAGCFNVPVALVSGDRAVTEEARSLLGNVETVTVKEGVGRFAARCVSPVKARVLIKEGTTKALQRLNEFKPFKISPPIKLDIVFIHIGMAEMAELVPGAKRVDGRTISFVSNDYLEVFKALRAMITLAGTNI
ncbi:MAG: D-aminopeptidase [Candidatus Bathyarchaeota archaeon BA1]|nr:MAG: D-aminopeptidase [Candidatus Bathyarchaeota archaeon BA1]